MNAMVSKAPRKVPVPPTATDRELAQRVHNFLVSKNVPALRNLDVEVHGESVVVSGRTKTFYEKQLASACCQRVAGVRHVSNRIVVDPPATTRDAEDGALRSGRFARQRLSLGDAPVR